MRKGEAKRQELLTTAEQLFLSKGYEVTSVQDILDVLHTSKGGFYHHFSSKEDVLRMLCTQHAERAAARTAKQLEAATDDMARINAVLRGFTPFCQEEADFLRMLAPSLRRNEGRAMAMHYQDALLGHFQPLLAREMAAATANGTICPPVREMEEPILQLVNACWMAIAAETEESIQPTAILTRLDRTRRAVEVLLDAPYGSVEILRVEEITQVAKLI